MSLDEVGTLSFPLASQALTLPPPETFLANIFVSGTLNLAKTFPLFLLPHDTILKTI